MSTFKLPDLGEGLAEAEILEWHVKPGDHVVVDSKDDKLTFEVHHREAQAPKAEEAQPVP